MAEKSVIGANIRRLREERGLSQEKLAELARTSQTTIDKIERGETRRSRFIYKIAHALGVALAEVDPEFFELPRTLTKNQTSDPEIITKILEDGDIAIFPSTELPDATMLIGTDIIYVERKPFFIPEWHGVYGLQIFGSSMEPEFSSGDVIYLLGNKGRERWNATYLLLESHPSRSGILRRLLYIDGTDWVVKRWSGAEGETERVARELYPHRHMVVGRKIAR